MQFNGIIVEDNKIELRKIIGILERIDKPELKLAAVFKDPEDALEYILKNKVDIIISDIQMPFMNGLELLNEVKKNNVKCESILVSCFDDFKYAQEAIDEGVAAYILKPVDEHELKEAVEKVIGRLLGNAAKKEDWERMQTFVRENKKSLRELCLKNALLTQNPDLKTEIIDDFHKLDMNIFDVNKAVCLFRWELEGDDKNISDYMINKMIAEFIADIESSTAKYFATPIENASIAVVIASALPNFDAIDEVMFIKNQVRKKYGIMMTAALSNEETDICKLGEQYRQCELIFNRVMSGNNDTVILYDDVAGEPEEMVNIDLDKLMMDVEKLVFAYNNIMAERFVEKYIGSESVHDTIYVKSLLYNVVNFVESFLNGCGKSLQSMVEINTIWRKVSNFTSADNAKNWLKNILRAGYEIVGVDEGGNQKNVVTQALNIMHRRYNEHLTLKCIASEVHLSARQLERVFQREVGMTIQTYLTEIRIEKAKEMLSSPGNSLQRIAESVGYTNKSHFVVTFERIVGVSPMEYRRSAQALH